MAGAAGGFMISPSYEEDAPIGLMGLVREIRYMIYHQLWLETPGIEVYYYSHRFEVWYKGRPSLTAVESTQGLPTWLLTNKAILDEGLDHLRLHGKWFVRESLLDTHLAAPLLKPIMTPHLTYVDNWYHFKSVQTEEGKSAVIECNPNFISAVAVGAPHLKVLLLVGLPRCRLERGTTCRVDLSGIANFNLRLEHLAINFRARDVKRSDRDLWKQALEDEVNRRAGTFHGLISQKQARRYNILGVRSR